MPSPGQLLLVAFLFPCALAANTYRIREDAGFPVVFVPGDAGSQLEANLTGKPFVVHYLCSKVTATWFDLWLNLETFAPWAFDCWMDNMKLVFDNNTKTTTSMPGVDVRVPGFGNTSSIEWLDKSKASQGRYFFDIVDAMASWGYRRGKDAVGAPYDWRKAPNEQADYYAQLKTLIENTYRWNNNKQVVVVAHSMGNPTFLYFLKNVVDQAWKDKFIKSFVSIAAPWGGSMQIVKLFANGYNMNYFRVILPPSELRDMQRSFMSSALLFPHSRAFPETQLLASSGEKNYTLANVQEFFTDIAYPLGWEQYKVGSMNTLLGGLESPGVQTHCIYGTGVPTPERFDWAKGYFPGYQPTIVYGDGDGTVNRNSAEVCVQWQQEEAKKKNGAKITVHNIEGAEHMAIMRDPKMIETVKLALYDKL